MKHNKIGALASVSVFALSITLSSTETWSAPYNAGTGNPFTVNATVSVYNTISGTESTPLDNGDMAVNGDPVDIATMIIQPDGTVIDDTAGPAILVHSSGTGVPGTFDITGAFPNTNLTVDMGNPVNLNCGACSGSQPDFELYDVTTDLPIPGSMLTAASAIGMTDFVGTLSFHYGMTIRTIPSANPYEAGIYNGSFDFFFSY